MNNSSPGNVPALPTMRRPSARYAGALARRAVGAAISESLGELLLAPLWWYTSGLIKVGQWWWHEVRQGAKRLSLPILFSHWFKPMYGQADTAGRIISFVFRTLMLLWTVLMMIIWLAVVTVAVVVYVLLPVVTVWQLIINWRWSL